MVLGHLAAVTIVATISLTIVSRDATTIVGLWLAYFLTWLGAVTLPYLLPLVGVM